MNKPMVTFANEPKQYNYWLSSLVCLCAGMYYLYEFVLQIAPNVMVPDLMRDFKVDAAQLGFISGFYYLAYTFMQIPAGLLYDRFGPRVLLTFATLVCAVGACAFGYTSSIWVAKLARFLIGGGSAFAFIGCLVLVSRWFPARYFALLAGLIQFMSSVGALIGAAPLAASVGAFGWRATIQGTAYFGFILAIIIWFVIRDTPEEIKSTQQPHHFKKGEWRRLLSVCSHPQTWWLGVYSMTTWVPVLVFASLWGVPYLTTYYNISATEAAGAVSMVWLSIGIGSPLLGWFSDKIGRRCLPFTLCSLIGLVAALIMFYVPNIPFGAMYPLLFVLGFASSAQALSFALVKDNNKPTTVGTAIGFNNMMVVCSGFFMQPLVGYVLRAGWDGSIVNGAPVYLASDYRCAFLIIPISSIIGLIISMFFLSESHCAPTYKKDFIHDGKDGLEQEVTTR